MYLTKFCKMINKQSDITVPLNCQCKINFFVMIPIIPKK
ncbi:hypothetical protein RAMDARK_0150 [Rickettsia amblyommatis str. Darkwater]|nr:hypothetical protein RAMDARK_0150 [Rickettsia amblyommatis str. Darkwater]